MSHHRITGVFSASATPLTADNRPDFALFTDHCLSSCWPRDATAWRCSEPRARPIPSPEPSAAPFWKQHLRLSIPAGRLLPGTGVVAIPETVELTRHALSLGVTKVVMLPPFYYKGVSDDGLFAAYSQVLEKVADTRLQVILYHIPQVSGVPLSIPLIGRLIAAFPETVVGIKESA